MTVFGIGTMELVLILLLLILIFGPERISETARWVGQAYRKVTGISAEVNQQVTQVRKAVKSAVDVPAMTDPLREATSEIGSLQKDLNRQLKQTGMAVAEVQSIPQDIAAELNQRTIAPPRPVTAVPAGLPATPTADEEE